VPSRRALTHDLQVPGDLEIRLVQRLGQHADAGFSLDRKQDRQSQAGRVSQNLEESRFIFHIRLLPRFLFICAYSQIAIYIPLAILFILLTYSILFYKGTVLNIGKSLKYGQ
jgi:hypothetical protein